MNWYYVENGQQAGPVDETQLQVLAQTGKIQPDTLVWREGMGNWAPYREAVPGQPPPSAPPVFSTEPAAASSGGVLCSECGRSFAPADVIRYGDRWVCAGCKPAFFQRLREGAAPMPGVGGVSSADVLARDYEVDIGGVISQGWDVFKANAGPLIGVSLLVYLALLAANIIPYLSIILSLLLTGPLMGGLWLYYIKTLRNEQPAVADAFSGFGPRFWQLVLTQLIPGLIVFACIFLLALMMVPAIMGLRLAGGAPRFNTAFLIPLVGVGLVAVVVLTYLQTCWLYGLALVADKGMRFWPALELSRRVVNKHWWMTFFLLVVCGLLMMAGVLACLVGLLVTGPLALAALAAHYEKLFGDMAPES